MTSETDESVPDTRYRTFLSYIDRTREYYSAAGYGKPYRWAYNEDAPFTPLTKPLSESRVGVVTTTFPFFDDRPAVWPNGRAKTVYGLSIDDVPDRMFTADLSWDKDATHTDDLESYLPLNQLRRLADAGRIGSVSPNFYGIPTDYSQRRTAADAATLLEMAKADDVDVMLLIPL